MAVYTHLSESELRRYIQVFSVGELIEARGISAGTINTIYEINTTHGRFILRILEGRTRSDARFEEELIVHLTNNALKVPKMMGVSKGGHVVSINPRQQLSIFEYLPGREVGVFEVTDEHCTQVGRFLSDMHVACRDLGRRRRNRFDLERLMEILVNCEQVNDSEEISAELSLIRRQFEEHKPPKHLPKGIVHGDLFIDNVRFSHGELCGVLDFEMASTGALSYDIAVALCDWAFSQNQLVPSRARALVAGYVENRRLTPAEKKALFGLCLFAATRFELTRIHDFEVMVTPDADRLYKDYRHFKDRLQSLQAMGKERFEAEILMPACNGS